MYPTFTASAGRACINSLAMELDLSESLDFKASKHCGGKLDTHNYDAMKLPAMHTASGKEARVLPTAKLVPCAKSLMMGRS